MDDKKENTKTDELKNSSAKSDEMDIGTVTKNQNSAMKDTIGQDIKDDIESTNNIDADEENTNDEIESEIEKIQEDEFEIPQDVQDLLKDINKTNPEGINLEETDDDEAVNLVFDLEAEMEKRSGNDYIKSLSWARSLLIKYSKNLNIAVWLTISWFRVAGLSGLQLFYSA